VLVMVIVVFVMIVEEVGDGHGDGGVRNDC